MINPPFQSTRNADSLSVSPIVARPENADSEFNENRLSAAIGDFGSAVLNYSCDDRNCHLTRSELELVDFDFLSR